MSTQTPQNSVDIPIEITPASIAAVVGAIKGTGPRVDRATYRAHVPKHVTRTGDIVTELAAAITAPTQAAEPAPCPHLTKALESIAALGEIEVPEVHPDLFDEIRESPQFEPLIASYLARNWNHFRAHTAALMGDFDPDYDCHVGEPDGLVDRFFTVVYGIDTQLVPVLKRPGHNPAPSVALVIGLVVAGDLAGRVKWSTLKPAPTATLSAEEAEPLMTADLGK